MTKQFTHTVMLAIAIVVSGLPRIQPTLAAPPAFPGAVGQGSVATGGRGGDVYHVTNLDDYDTKKAEVKLPGSFRHAVRSAQGPRTIVFDVGGAIKLHGPFAIDKSDLTIAGQTSPGGVTLWGYPSEISDASNVILRFMRFRTGDFNARRTTGPSTQTAAAQGNNDMDPSSANGFYVGDGCDRVIVDHISTTWGLDETFSVTRGRNVTVQNSIIAESLSHSLHPKGDHGYGSLVRGELTPADQEAGLGGFTFYRNLWAHHLGRNPSLGGQQKLDDGQREADRRRTDVNLVNNVIYDWGGAPTHRSELGQVRANIVGNYYVSGPAKNADYVFRENVPAPTTVYQRGNFADLDEDAKHDGAEVEPADAADAFRDFGEDDELISDGEPLNFFGDLAQHAIAADEAYAAIVETVGASLWRDAADERVVSSLVARSGGLIDSQEQFRGGDGKLPGIDDLGEQRRPTGFDSDGDGMPDAFEAKHNLDAHDPADGAAVGLNSLGYSNLEVYLDGLAEETQAKAQPPVTQR